MSETQSESKRTKGQFAKGNPGGPGNPHAKQVARIRATLLAALEPATLYEIVCRLIERAVNGNLEAIKILLAYSVGRPGKSADLVELLSEHYPPPGQESGERDQESEGDRHQTDETVKGDHYQTAETVKGDHYQTAETAAPPVGQVADLPKAPADVVSCTSDRLAESRHQTEETVSVDRHQTDQTVAVDVVYRHQTEETAPIDTAERGGGRHQTGVTVEERDPLVAMLGETLRRATILTGNGSASALAPAG